MDKEHLNVQDIMIGDYIQEWREIPGVFSMPMYVSCIFDDGDLYLNFDGNEADPWDANVKDVYDIPIDLGILPHFGFFEEEHHLWTLKQGEWKIAVHIYTYYVSCIIFNKDARKVLWLGDVSSIRKLQHRFYETTKKPLKLTFE